MLPKYHLTVAEPTHRPNTLDPGRGQLYFSDPIFVYMKQKFPDVPTIAITGCSDIGIAVQLLKNDACDFVMKRFNLVIVQEFTRIALEKTRVDMEMRQLRRSLRQGYALGGMLSRTPQGASNIRNHSRGSTHRFEGYD